MDPSLTDPIPPNARTQVNFLIERAHAEAALFWTRTTVFLGIHTFSLAATMSWLSGDNPPSKWIISGFASLGFLYCAIWFQVIRVSRYYNDSYLNDARALAMRTGCVADYRCALGFLKHVDKCDRFSPATQTTDNRSVGKILWDGFWAVVIGVFVDVSRWVQSQWDELVNYLQAKKRPNAIPRKPAPTWPQYDTPRLAGAPPGFLWQMRPLGPSATKCTFLVVILFAAAWVLVGIAAFNPSPKLTKAGDYNPTSPSTPQIPPSPPNTNTPPHRHHDTPGRDRHHDHRPHDRRHDHGFPRY